MPNDGASGVMSMKVRNETRRASRLLIAAAALGLLFGPSVAGAADPAPVTSLSLHGTPKYGKDFDHFDYADPSAPKGGDVVLSAIGTFDSLNAFILKGTPAAGVQYNFDTLLTESLDEPSTAYGLVAESVEVPADKSWVIFNINPKAHFSDGSPITAADVAWTFTTLMKDGSPTYAAYYAAVDKAEILSPSKVKFTFKPGDNNELPLILGQLPVLSQAYYGKVPFNQTSFDPPLGSGPYKIVKVDASKSITYQRDPNYWAKDLPVNRGRYNFQTIRYDYYRDPTIAIAALKGGAFDWRYENSSKSWATDYDTPAVQQGQLVKEAVPSERPSGMQGFEYNIRRPVFQDRRVRQALAYAFDFEWSNKTLFYGAYTRTRSYFENSPLAATGLPSPEELKILEPFRGKIPDEVFTQEYQPPKTDGSGNIRANLGAALKLLTDAGWTVKNNQMVDKSGKPMAFEILLADPQFERIVLPFVENLKRLGINAQVRTIDPAQYQHRMENFDFDMAVGVFPESLSPGNEQRDFWGSASASTPGGQNTIGIKDPVVDQLVDQLIAATDWDSLVAHTRALDRVLQWGFYVIPQFHTQEFRFVYWNMFGHPKVSPKYMFDFDSWWVDKAKASTITMRGAR
jgi:microcin C transport system substrate-binding protein